MKKLEKIVFTASPKHSVFLEVTVTNKDDVKLKITQGSNTAEMPINDLSHTVVKGLIEEKIAGWITDFAGKTIAEMFTSSEIEKIDWLVVETIITKTARNDIAKNDLKAIFRFVDTIPFYKEEPLGDFNCETLSAQSPQRITLMADSLLGADKSIFIAARQPLLARMEHFARMSDSLDRNSKDSSRLLEELRYKRDSLRLVDSANTTLLNALNAKLGSLDRTINRNNELIALNKKQIDRLMDNIKALSPALTMPYRDTVCRGKSLNVQAGRLFIDSMEITIKDGFLRVIKFRYNDSMEIFTDHGLQRVSRLEYGFNEKQQYTVFVDMRSVSFSEFLLDNFFYLTNRKADHSTKGRSKYLFNLDDVLKYTPPQNAEVIETFVPQRSRVFFTKNNASVLVPETDVNKIITLNLFSDIVGVQEDKPNGLLQAEAKFYGSLQRDRYPGRLRYSTFSFFNYFEINFTLSKIENKLKYIELLPNETPGDTFSYVHSFNLMQFQNLEFGAKLNLLKYTDDVHEGHLIAGIAASRTGARDSLVQLTDDKEIITPRNMSLWSTKYSLKALYRLKAISRVGVDVSVCLTGMTLLSDDVRQSGGYYNELDLSKNTYVKHEFWKNLIATYQAQIYYYATRDESQRLYARLALNTDISVKGNRFAVIQLGYSADINKFLQFK
ncbi:hypothetical protein [Chitinophaga cymbidii]|uniref:Uncharacterized protein n=1 Tax=Chitinophaga cymbidii TaxID=1096750 RepID=A0A512RFS8_9BACT|nr:hypothetical protein [Chitinophaga cymbidii]GEP94545.1 hypothetical protein CCY01nite_08050 [Chitinophaga cymbidii]